jgi:hypothetical protein
MRVLIPTLRGALGFGLAMLITFGVFQWALFKVQTVPQVLLWPVMLGAPFGAGALGAAILGGGPSGGKASGAFGCGFFVMWFIVSFSLISLQGGGQPDYGWGALAGGVAFALVGAAGSAAIDRRLIVPAALFFGIAGALGGAGAFYLSATVSMIWGVLIAWTTAGVAAGALLGAYMGFAELDEPPSRFREGW